jgi:hypothetical protein
MNWPLESRLYPHDYRKFRQNAKNRKWLDFTPDSTGGASIALPTPCLEMTWPLRDGDRDEKGKGRDRRGGKKSEERMERIEGGK